MLIACKATVAAINNPSETIFLVVKKRPCVFIVNNCNT